MYSDLWLENDVLCNTLWDYWLAKNPVVLTGLLVSAPQGGSAYVLLKGVLKVYFTKQLFIMHAGRRILNYGDVQRAERHRDGSGN